MTKTNEVIVSNSVRKARTRACAILVGLLAGISGGVGAVDIAQTPLYAGSKVPGNLALVPSVEFPTVISAANLATTYTASGNFVGYFDSAKCYRYHYSGTETERHFYPVGFAATGACVSANEWSGNFLNWAATQTIDPFRSALTGGYRVKDTVDETWLEKAFADAGQGGTGNFDHRSVTSSTVVAGATPVQWGAVHMRILHLGNKMRFGADATRVQAGTNLVSYDPATHALDNGDVMVDGTPRPGNQVTYELSVRVKVCDASVGLEANCVGYPSGYYKPEGLIQEYSNRILYSAFSYQNVNGQSLDGGVLRANQKFVGPLTHYPESGPQANANREWDPATGIIYKNPDPLDAAATSTRVLAGGGTCGVAPGVGESAADACTIRNSGVINYLNKFGQMNTGKSVKSQDNVSELYYAAVRYFKHLGDVPEYSALSGNVTNRYQRADGFPIITDWNEVVGGQRVRDPIRYQCQTNVILGIGDTNTWQDKNLPSASATSGDNEPTKPLAVQNDDTVDVIEMMTKIWQMEMGWTEAVARDRATRRYFNNDGHRNSGYIAALAYDSHTRDIRPQTRPNGFPGVQTISTHWVDVIEGRTDNNYKTTETNQYYLTGKYGGFNVPSGYDPDTNVTPLPQALWSDGDMTPRFMRPRNFYAAADATRMISSLRLAFERILDEIVGSGGGFAANTTVLEAGAKTFQARFRVDGASWSGDLQAYDVDVNTGALTPSWLASGALPDWEDRNIWINSGGFRRFENRSNLSGPHQSELSSQDVVDYLRGDRGNEAPGGTLRRRAGVIGDIVNSEPVFVGAPNPRLFLGAGFSGAASYQAFAADNAARRQVVYVGANDGMLHAFDADDGEEVFAFIPSVAVDAGLGEYADPAFEHRYFVDGELTVADVFDTTSDEWKTILVGTMGRGGRGMFALDVTDPDNVGFLWERSSTHISALGNNLGKPIIAQVDDGEWRVFLGNGPNGSDTAQLISLDVFTGFGSTLTTGVGGDNGLSGVNLWSSVPSGFTDTAYAGDLAGNLWKFDLATGVPTKLFTAGATQPISATPLVSRRPGTNETWVFFGTGRYLNEADLANEDRQAWYGVIDRGSEVLKDTLREMKILAEGEIEGVAVRGIQQEDAITSGNGWYMDLVSPVAGEEGERMVVPNKFRGRALIGTTRIPDAVDPCSPSGRGFIMAIDPFSGGRLPGGSFFDVDGDGSFDETIGEPPIPVSGIGTPSGPNSPIFIGDIMQVSLDDATSQTVETSGFGMEPERVSWRELYGN